MTKKLKSNIYFLILPTLIFSVLTSTLHAQQLRMAFITIKDKQELKKLTRMGVNDIAAVRELKNPDGTLESLRVEAVISQKDEINLDRQNYLWSYVKKTKKQNLRSFSKTAESQKTVYHSFDEAKLGIKDQLIQISKDFPNITELKTIGHSIQGRPIFAMSVTKNNYRGKYRGYKPEVLYLATHHAREWVATQMAMRLLKYLTSNYGTNKRITKLLQDTKVWIIPVANPDGYEYTFTNERLWRKNLRDNNGDQVITLADGVDLNRNFDSMWGLNNEGSSADPTSNTYRGASPNSEPETKAVVDFIMKRKKRIKFIISYHTYGDLILYPLGWQVKTKSYDDPIFVAQSGTDDNPAILDRLMNQGYDPGVSADLYTTNGEFGDWGYQKAKIPTYIVELTAGKDVEGNHYGFEFPDNEKMVQTVFEDNLEFAISLGESAKDPSNPVSPVNMNAKIAYHDPISESHGVNQEIEILVKKRVFPIIFYTINGGIREFETFNSKTGKYYNKEQGIYYNKYKAVIKNQKKGDEVKYWIRIGRKILGPYNYSVVKASNNKILIVNGEDYSGRKPLYDPNNVPHYLGYYTDALDDAGYSYDIFDMTKQKKAPNYVEVLSHYDIVIWYTGDDIYPTVPDSTIHEDAKLNFRDYLNYGNGNLFATGQDLAFLSSVYGRFPNDFFQYYFGAYMHFRNSGMNPESKLPYDIKGKEGDPIFKDLKLQLHGGSGANNQNHASTFLLTNHFLPHFKNKVAASYDRPGGPFDPHSGQYYVYSQMADRSYKRLGRTVKLPTGSPKLKFWTSFDIETNWDYAFVEIREKGTDNWTTLPDINNLTTTNTGSSCNAGWVQRIHPFLGHYMDESCNPTGTTGTWNGLTGSSGGWKQIEMDLSAYADKEVEIYISYASDWGAQNLGVFIDDIEITGLPIENFENGLGDWSISEPTGTNSLNNWIHMTGAGFPEGPAIRSENTLYLGFGFEAINNDKDRATLMDRIIRYFKKK